MRAKIGENCSSNDAILIFCRLFSLDSANLAFFFVFFCHNYVKRNSTVNLARAESKPAHSILPSSVYCRKWMIEMIMSERPQIHEW